MLFFKQYIIPNGYFIGRASVCLMVELVLTITPKCTQDSALVRILMQSLPTHLIILISIAANELYVYKSLWVPHAGTGPNHNTQWLSELCFSLNSLTVVCLMSAYANIHA